MPLRELLACVLLLTGPFAATSVIVHAAPKPLPPLAPEEIELRALVQPFRDGVTTGDDLKPLRDWLETRRAASKERGADRELRRVLKRIHDDANRDLLRAAEWIHRLQVDRTKLYQGLTKENAPLARTLEKLNEAPALPDAEDLLPGRTGISDADLYATDAGSTIDPSPDFSTSDQESPDSTSPTIDRVVDKDMDKERVLNRLTLDLTMLGHLLHECDNEYESERDRHRDALAALEVFLNDHRSAARQG